MNHSDRMAFFESMLGSMVGSGHEGSYITFERVGDRDEYVQYKLHRARVYGEVCSRQWCDPERPLQVEAVDRLAALGFSGGGPERNYARDGLPPSAPELAQLAESLFRAAYGLDDEYAVLVHLNLNDVTMPRAVPFTRDLIESELRDRGVRYLKDQDGELQADFTCAGSDKSVTMRFLADGERGHIYRISSRGSSRPVPATREEALERCNAWNRDHRWPAVAVLDGADGWEIVANSNVNLEPGVTVPLFRSFTESVICAALDFWEWIAAPGVAQAPSSGEEGG